MSKKRRRSRIRLAKEKVRQFNSNPLNSSMETSDQPSPIPEELDSSNALLASLVDRQLTQNVSGANRLSELERENLRLRRLLKEAELDKAMLVEALRGLEYRIDPRRSRRQTSMHPHFPYCLTRRR